MQMRLRKMKKSYGRQNIKPQLGCLIQLVEPVIHRFPQWFIGKRLIRRLIKSTIKAFMKPGGKLWSGSSDAMSSQ